jgi:hypothetical protein
VTAEERAVRIESAIGARGYVLNRDGTIAERLQAAAEYFAGLGIEAAPDADELEAALAAHGTDVRDFDTAERIAERHARAEQERSDAAAAALAAQEERERAAAGLARVEERRRADAARERRDAELRAAADALEADAETKANEAEIMRERALAYRKESEQ